MIKRYKVRNWEQYQHYSKRCPPWVKLHYELLTSMDWVTLSDQSRVLMIACMLIASRNEGYIPNNPAYIKRLAHLNATPEFTELIECGFVVPEEDSLNSGASNMLASASNMLACASVSASVSVSEGGVGETNSDDDVIQPKEEIKPTQESKVLAERFVFWWQSKVSGRTPISAADLEKQFAEYLRRVPKGFARAMEEIDSPKRNRNEWPDKLLARLDKAHPPPDTGPKWLSPDEVMAEALRNQEELDRVRRATQSRNRANADQRADPVAGSLP